MHKEEIEALLSQSGFSVSLSRKLGTTRIVHVIRTSSVFGELVEYNFNETADTVELIYGYRDTTLSPIMTKNELEEWLKK